MNLSLEIIIQIFGILIPACGILVLLEKEQNRAATYLMLANIGCLIVNACYMLLLKSHEMDEALLALKMEYIGNALFYFFFVVFLLTYLRIEIPKVILLIWVLFETSQLFIIWNDNYKNMFFDNMAFKEGIHPDMHYISTEAGTLYAIRYGIIAVVLLILLGVTLYRLTLTKMDYERKNLRNLMFAQTIIIISLSITMTNNWQYDISPVCLSVSILFIILSVAKGDMFSVLDRGRTWIFDNIQDIFIIADSAYGFIDANRLAIKNFPELRQLKKNQELSERVKDLFVEEDDDILEIQGKVYEKKISIIVEKEITLGYCLMLIDVTGQYELLKEVKRERDRAEEANRSKSAFLSNMSHEIRTPMNAIVGMTEILLREKWPQKQESYLLNVKSSGKALLLLINDILDFSKIESGKLEIIEEKYEPMSMLKDLSMIFLNRIGEKNIELIFDIDKNMPNVLYGDELRVRQVILNIVNNAIKFTENGYVKLILYYTKETDDVADIKIVVEDTGQGIKSEDLEKLFAAFNQVDTKKNRSKEGTGLGLAISKQLVEMMGGRIDVESEYLKGSRFTFNMKQKIVDTKAAADIKDEVYNDRQNIVVGNLSLEIENDILRKLAKQYDMQYIEYAEFEQYEEYLSNFYIFFDAVSYELASDVIKDKISKEKDNIRFCIMQNPMKENIDGRKISILNKPLFTLNFCQFINNEENSVFMKDENDISFVAPEARVLLVDDNEINIKVALGLMSPINMQIDTAENGKEAVSKIIKNRYDLVLMDHMMPVMDGIEATGKIRSMEEEYYKNLPIIALTANAVSGAREEFIKAGMNDFVGKPIEMKDLCLKLRRWLPKDKIKRSEVDIIDNKEEIDISDIPNLEGIDVLEGIKNSGSKELFLRLLGDYYKMVDIKAKKLDDCLRDNLIRDFTIEVHALKSTSRMIGALDLSQRFLRLEEYGNDNNIIAINKEYEETMSLFKNYKKILKSFGSADEFSKKQVDKSVLIKILKNIQTCMDSFDLDGADAAMKELEECSIPKECESSMDLLRAYMADVAMEDIMNTSLQMIELLEN